MGMEEEDQLVIPDDDGDDGPNDYCVKDVLVLMVMQLTTSITNEGDRRSVIPLKVILVSTVMLMTTPLRQLAGGPLGPPLPGRRRAGDAGASGGHHPRSGIVAGRYRCTPIDWVLHTTTGVL
jgi:hypothetical protein